MLSNRVRAGVGLRRLRPRLYNHFPHSVVSKVKGLVTKGKRDE